MKNYWRKIKEENAYNGFRKIIRRHFLSPDGRQAEFDIKAENDTVSVLALTGDHKIILAEQFRHGPETICLELPGGSIDGKENSKEAAQRELLEETGYAGEIVFVGTSLHDAYSTMTCYHFVALNCVKVQELKLDKDEFINVVKMSMQEFRRFIKQGNLTDMGSAYLGLDYLGKL